MRPSAVEARWPHSARLQWLRDKEAERQRKEALKPLFPRVRRVVTPEVRVLREISSLLKAHAGDIQVLVHVRDYLQALPEPSPDSGDPIPF